MVLGSSVTAMPSHSMRFVLLLLSPVAGRSLRLRLQGDKAEPDDLSRIHHNRNIQNICLQKRWPAAFKLFKRKNEDDIIIDSYPMHKFASAVSAVPSVTTALIKIWPT